MAQYPADPNDTSFIEKLRMSNLYPVGQTGTQTYGMPNFQGTGGGGGGMDDFSGMLNKFFGFRERVKEADRNRMLQDQRNQLYRSGAIDPLTGKPRPQPQQMPNVQVQESALGNIGSRIMGPTVAEKESVQMKQAPDIMRGQAALKGAETDERQAELAAKIQAGKATDAEKQEFEMAQIEARNRGEMGVQDVRGRQAMEQIGAQGANAREIERMRGQQELEQQQRGFGFQQELGRQKQSTAPFSRQQQTRRALDILDARPDWSQYVGFTPSGAVQIAPDAPIDIWNQINTAMNQRDIYLPDETPTYTGGGATAPVQRTGGTPTSRTPTSRTPTGSDPLGIR